jgi:hypothetical protein
MEVTGRAAVNGDLVNTPNWAAFKAVSTTPSIGAIIKDAAGTHIFICTTTGTVGGSEPAWVTTTLGSTTTDGTVTWTYIGTSFTGWGAPSARLTTMQGFGSILVACSLYIASSHAETSAAAITMNANSNLGSSWKHLCVNAAGSVPPTAADLTIGATITSTVGGTAGITIDSGATGNQYYYGITYIATPASAATNSMFIGNANTVSDKFENCQFKIGNANGGNILFGSNISSSTCFMELINTSFSFANTLQHISLCGTRLYWHDTATPLPGSVPNSGSLINAVNSGGPSSFMVEDVDLSAMGTGASLYGAACIGYNAFKNCRLGAGTPVINTTMVRGCVIDLVNCDNGATNYRNERYLYEGTKTTELIVVRSGGASDGTTAYSQKIVTGTGSSWYFPYTDQAIPVWIDSAGVGKTITLYGIASFLPNNDEFWFEVQYLSSSGSPVGARLTTTKSNILATGTALATDTSVWGGSIATPHPFKITTSITPQMKGFIYVIPKMAKPSSTIYYDPLIGVV